MGETRSEYVDAITHSRLQSDRDYRWREIKDKKGGPPEAKGSVNARCGAPVDETQDRANAEPDNCAEHPARVSSFCMDNNISTPRVAAWAFALIMPIVAPILATPLLFVSILVLSGQSDNNIGWPLFLSLLFAPLSYLPLVAFNALLWTTIQRRLPSIPFLVLAALLNGTMHGLGLLLLLLINEDIAVWT